jgi:hypothetical protein
VGEEGSPFAYLTKVSLFRREREKINGGIVVAKEVTNVFRVEKGFKGLVNGPNVSSSRYSVTGNNAHRDNTFAIGYFHLIL